MLKGYIEVVLTVGAFISVAASLSHPKLKGITGFGAGILLICVISLPLVDIISEFDIDSALDGIIGDMDVDGMTDDALELAFEDGIEQYISEKYKVDKSCVIVFADGFDIESIRADRIYVSLSGRASFLDYKKIEEDIALNFTKEGECEVSLKIG